MKLRFTPSSIRLRLNQVEVAEFALQGKLTESVNLPGPAQTTFIYGLRFGTDSEAGSVRFKNGEFSVIIPQERARAWANDAKEIGLYYNHSSEGGKSLRLIIEKDYQCIDGPPEEHDPAGYPNPLAKVGCKPEKR